MSSIRRRTFQEVAAANRRASLFYCFLMILLLSALGAVIVAYYVPEMWWHGALAAAFLGGILALAAELGGSGIVLSVSQARTATEHEMRMVHNVAEEMAIAAGMPKPEVFVIDDSSPNAFATGRGPNKGVVVVTTGLLRKLNRDELQAVVGHEMAHIRNNDIRLMTTLAVIAGVIPLLADFFLRMVWWGGSRRNNNQGAVIILVIGLVLAILAPVFATLLQMAVSRKREYMADAGAVELTRNPDALASALDKLVADTEPLEAANRATAHLYIVNPLRKLREGRDSLFCSHPPIRERVRLLRGMAGTVDRTLDQP